LLDVNVETGTANGDLLFNITAAFSQFDFYFSIKD
jgi:hypothetical protein